MPFIGSKQNRMLNFSAAVNQLLVPCLANAFKKSGELHCIIFFAANTQLHYAPSSPDEIHTRNVSSRHLYRKWKSLVNFVPELQMLLNRSA